MKAGYFASSNMIQSTISLEMPVPSQDHYGILAESLFLL
jgi:hypothetical protein